MNTIFLIVFLSSLIATALTMLAGYFYAKKRIDTAHLIKESLSKIDLAAIVEPVVDEKMENFLEKIVVKFPMAALFLNGSMGQQMQGMAKDEVLKWLPVMKDQIAEKTAKQFEIASLIKDALQKWGAPIALILAILTTFFTFLALKISN